MTKTDTVVEFDAMLIERARRGDTRAFERLYREHVGRVNGLCLRMTRNPDLAADCTQDAFIKAWKALPRFEARSSFSTWLHRIAVNTVLERRRGGMNSEVPVEDPTVDWKAPFRKVATIRIPPQVFDTPERKSFAENLSFTPWHSLPDHRPIGGINRARKAIYRAISIQRHTLNDAPRREPTE